MQRLECAALIGRFDSDFEILRERLQLRQLCKSWVEADTRELLRLTDEHRIKIDHWLTIGTHARDRRFEDHVVREDAAHRIFRCLLAG